MQGLHRVGRRLQGKQDTANIIEICVNNIGGGGAAFGIGRSGNTPVQQGGVSLAAEDASSGISYSTLGIVWTIAPTVPVQYFRQFYIGNGRHMIYAFPRGLLVASGASIVIWSLLNASLNANSSWVISE
jgi:hypothetical protein